jgi:NAD(P)H-hydrate epimerase
LLAFPAADLVGDIQIGEIGDISKLTSWNLVNRGVLTDRDISQYLPIRPRDAHKGTFGTAFIVSGAGNYPGAVILAGTAAYRIGAGLVKIAIPEYIYSAVVGELKEATWVRLPHTSGWIREDADQVISQVLGGINALLVGPGIGTEATTSEFVHKLVMLNLPNTVIDADGLKLLADIPDWYLILHERVILTPHPGEMAVLTGISKEEIQANRLEVAETYAHQWGKVVVLKGAYTIIADPGGTTAIVPVATPALAKAGTGDVLAGLIVGLLAQGVSPFTAACIGAFIHARAGLMVAKEQENTSSVLAGDLLNVIPRVLSRYFSTR